MNFPLKIRFLLQKPKVVFITGDGRQAARADICQVLKDYFKIGKEVVVFEAEDKEINKFAFYFKNSKFSILVMTHTGNIPSAQDFFAGEKDKVKTAKKLIKDLPAKTHLVLNYDDETARETANFANFKVLKFGFSDKSDIFASDIKTNGGTNFKINYKGNIVPVWLETVFSKEQVYSALAAITVGVILGLNLVEISQSFKKI